MIFGDSEINWNNLESNTIQALRFACQERGIYPKGSSKKDLVRALRSYQRSHNNEEQGYQRQERNNSQVYQEEVISNGNVKINRKLFDDFEVNEVQHPKYTYSGKVISDSKPVGLINPRMSKVNNDSSSSYSSSYSSRSYTPVQSYPKGQNQRKVLSLIISFILLILILLVLTQLS